MPNLADTHIRKKRECRTKWRVMPWWHNFSPPVWDSGMYRTGLRRCLKCGRTERRYLTMDDWGYYRDGGWARSPLDEDVGE